VVNNTDLFIKFKESMNEPSKDLYHICSKLVIKIPIITFNKTNKKIENLSLKIKEELNQLGLFNICES
ncbi:hypothetical protein V7183_25795, partial [Bacillus sp. JJ1127]|uniref:hypothetical protein n=1 Tax=Bacillus sp. JJ1127 TaxID=3122952 RepID=UPI003070B7C8